MKNFRISILLLPIFICQLFSNDIFEYQNRNEAIFSVDTAKTLANFVYDQKRTFYPEKVFDGAVVFIKTDYLDEFFTKFHPKISGRYILITHDGDRPSPREFAKYLNDEKLIAWLGQNPTIKGHKKFHPIPICIAGKNWKHGNVNTIRNIQNLCIPRQHLAYLNINVGTYPKERKLVQRLFHNKDYCLSADRRTFEQYLMDLKTSKFVFSPRGNGLDCHRTWEAILMGAIPIVRTSELDPLLEGLPVLIIDDWNKITKSFLEEKYAEMKEKEFSIDKLFLPYWKSYITDLLENEGISR